ncbi:MAG: heme exporter protein CcmB [Deltaproteobacteria bacterium]|nr:heme exporter protein CcmB [Deltaproteobacteria bacterium]
MAAKDLRIELRTKEVVVTTGLFALLVVVLSSLAFYLSKGLSERIAPGVLWVAIAFAGVMAVGRSWERERDNQVLRALLLAPMPRGALFIGKLIANLAFVFAIEAIVLPLTALFFHVDLLPILGMLLALLVLGTVGFVAAGTLFGALSARSTSARDLVLSLVVFPLIAPALLGAVVATRDLFAGASLAELLGWIRALAAFDLIFLAAGVALFDPLLAD